ncbi:LADA_0B07200g1_1 [Lachancea dasiensis]|uniref:LADA_0B07200g1_1 n=1 Tax=Lachancea dasiensis TaxID=1072105 RepID=A0A1G4IU03_9SACH|nr:LADA_0B07200g1_1 [Lachancea dasiensis]
MEPLVISVVDCNVKHGLEAQGADHPDHESQALMFPTNVKYIFEDDEESLVEEEYDGVENVIVVEANANLEVTRVEVISDDYKLLKFETAEDDELMISAVSKFEPLDRETWDQPLEKLVEIYRCRNEQLERLYETLVADSRD